MSAAHVTTLLETEVKRSFRIERADGTVEEFLSRPHLEEFGGDVEVARLALGWITEDGAITPLQTATPGKPGHPFHVIHARRGTFVSSHATREAAQGAADTANAHANAHGVPGTHYVVITVAPTPEVI